MHFKIRIKHGKCDLNRMILLSFKLHTYKVQAEENYA